MTRSRRPIPGMAAQVSAQARREGTHVRSEFPEDFLPEDGDIVITKRQWGAFTGTELDLQLRRRGVTQLVSRYSMSELRPSLPATN
jgi:nicotinamidase-related amidase